MRTATTHLELDVVQQRELGEGLWHRTGHVVVVPDVMAATTGQRCDDAHTAASQTTKQTTATTKRRQPPNKQQTNKEQQQYRCRARAVW
jgi:hypothetical protein